jgi:hypothetical protein
MLENPIRISLVPIITKFTGLPRFELWVSFFQLLSPPTINNNSMVLL